LTTAPLGTVSIVIPCYNQARFLGDAIESARRQSIPPLDLIVVDDGSTDDVAPVVKRYPGVQYLAQRNEGAPSARNRGFRASRGDFVLFLDADDRLLPEALALGLSALAEHPDWAFVTGHVRLIAAGGTIESTPPQAHAEGNQFLALLRSNYIWSPGSVLYRRALLDAGGPFDPSVRASADYELNIRLARQYGIGCHHGIVLEYRRHGDNMSAEVGEMLRSAVSVRLRQRRFVAAHPAALQAWKDGIEIVRADYGGQLVAQVRRDVRDGQTGRAARGLLYLARYYRAGLLRMLLARDRAPASA
jgi:glycosyltransferase involved in cell wall biosynthesis